MAFSGEHRALNPMELLARHAEAVGLLGRKGAEDVDTSGDQNRISHAEAVGLRQKFTAYLTPFVREVEHPAYKNRPPFFLPTCVLSHDACIAYNSDLVSNIKRLANGTMHGHDLSRLSVLTGFMRSGWYREDGKYISVEGGKLFNHTAEATGAMVYAIAMLEGNLPPNDLGYRADEQVSLYRKYEIVNEQLTQACAAAQQAEWVADDVPFSVFGAAQATAEIMNKVVDRAELGRPTFMDKRIGDPFPRYSPGLSI